MKDAKSISKKTTALCMVVLFVMLNLMACKKDGEVVSSKLHNGGDSGKEKAMGRYIEEDIKLPEGETMDSIMSLQKSVDGKIVLFTKDVSSQFAVYYSYTLKKDNQWEKKECQWLNDKRLDSKNTYLNIVLGKDNKLYAKYQMIENENSSVPTQIICSEDGINAEEIKIPELTKKDINGLYPYVKDISVLANGNIVVSTFNKGIVYMQDSGNKLLEFATELGKIESFGDIIYHYNTQGNTVELYDGANGSRLKSFPITLKESYEAILNIKEDKSIVMYSPEGIQLMKDGSDLWEIIADSNSGTIGSPKYYGISFITGE